MHTKNIFAAGKPLGEADKVLIMLHGRGANARDILGLAPQLNVSDFTLLAPQATGNTWYPYSFLAKPEENAPWLSSALDLLKETVDELLAKEIPSTGIYLLGFSQGACLTLEFAARNARRWGGVLAFTGGLIGEQLNQENYSGDFEETPVFIGTGDPDPHVPLERVKESARVLGKMNARVDLQIYENRPHTILGEELERANLILTG